MERAYKIAVVDDECESLASISRALTRVGYEVTSFEDGEVALQNLEVLKDTDLVVTDLKMPRVDGLDLLKAVRHVNQEAGCLIVTGQSNRRGGPDTVHGSFTGRKRRGKRPHGSDNPSV